MNLQETIRALLLRATKEGAKLSLRQVSDLTGVEHNRLWRFLSDKHPDVLRLDDAEKIHQALTGNPLKIELNEND